MKISVDKSRRLCYYSRALERRVGAAARERRKRQVTSTLKIKQRKKQGTLRFASEKTQQSNSGKRKFLGKIRAEQALKLIVAAKVDMIQILESLILAQDERWRRA